jgi:hypothetical protein
MMEPDRFAFLIYLIARFVPFSITSWGRTPQHNQAVGGKPNSKHLQWLAVDVVLDNPNQKPELIKWCSTVGLLALDERDHIHIQPKET